MAAFVLMILVVACAFFFVGMLYRDRTFSCIENAWLKATVSPGQQKWLAENGKNYKTLAEARMAWYGTDTDMAKSDREKAERRYRDFLAGLGNASHLEVMKAEKNSSSQENQ